MFKIPVLVSSFTLLLAGTLCLLSPARAHEDHPAITKSAPYSSITAQDLQAMIEEKPELIIIDSRGENYFDGTLIKGAKALSAKETNEETLAALVPNKATPIVFYCTNVNCPASKIAAYKAEKAGYTSLYKYPGGIEEWQSLNLPVTHVNAE